MNKNNHPVPVKRKKTSADKWANRAYRLCVWLDGIRFKAKKATMNGVRFIMKNGIPMGSALLSSFALYHVSVQSKSNEVAAMERNPYAVTASLERTPQAQEETLAFSDIMAGRRYKGDGVLNELGLPEGRGWTADEFRLKKAPSDRKDEAREVKEQLMADFAAQIIHRYKDIVEKQPDLIVPSIELILAQTSMESMWGLSKVAYGNFNYGGIKFNSRWEGRPGISQETTNAYDDDVDDRFVIFESGWYFMKYYLELLDTYARRAGLEKGADNEAWAAALCASQRDARKILREKGYQPTSEANRNFYASGCACSYTNKHGKTVTRKKNERYFVKLPKIANGELIQEYIQKGHNILASWH